MPNYRELIQDIFSILDSYSVQGYIVGGIARDIMLGVHSNSHYKDIDIALCCIDIPFSEKKGYEILHSITQSTASKYKAKYTVHDMYYTSSLSFVYGGERIFLDYALTRTEIYRYPASQPDISIGKDRFYTIYEDIQRRDFTINAIAFPLAWYISYLQKEYEYIHEEKSIPNISKHCIAVEYALKDAQRKVLRILHSSSFYDDPTRMIRLLTYVERYRCSIEITTEIAYYEAYYSHVLYLISTESIIRIIEYACTHAHDILALVRLYIQYAIYAFYFSSFYNPCRIYEALHLFIKYKSFCSTAEQQFLFYSLCTHHSLHCTHVRVSSLYTHMLPSIHKKRYEISKKKRLYPIGYSMDNYIHTKHTRYIEYIQSYKKYREYASSCRDIYRRYYKLFATVDNQLDIKYEIALFCCTLSHRDIIYLLLQHNIRYKIILEEYLYFKYTRKDIILFTINDLPYYDKQFTRELYHHVIASIFAKKLYSKEEQITCAIEIIQRLQTMRD